jgi:hypothetical protein
MEVLQKKIYLTQFNRPNLKLEEGKLVCDKTTPGIMLVRELVYAAVCNFSFIILQ